MKYGLKMLNKMCFAALAALAVSFPAVADSVPSGFSRPLEWRIWAEVSPSFVPGTNTFIRGENPIDRRIRGSFAADLKAGFSFSSDSREGQLYHGAYQGLGVGMNTFFTHSLLGTPTSLYVYQGAPIVHFGDRLWLGYEWQFGAAFGWKGHSYDDDEYINMPVSTRVTAHMGLSLKLHYSLTDRWQLSMGLAARHFSNGNTSLPNAGVNTLGVNIGVTYIINPQPEVAKRSAELEDEADRGRWMYDIMAFGAWRRRIVTVGEPPESDLCPGKFGVAGLQFSPLRRLNRYVAVGPALDVQWDESAGLAPYWIEGSYDENIKFERPPFGKQLSGGVSAHAELTMPIFSINAGLGYDMVKPKGEKRFYQSLALKAFLTRSIFLNVGYRLGNFKDPQNLMLGVGVRL